MIHYSILTLCADSPSEPVTSICQYTGAVDIEDILI